MTELVFPVAAPQARRGGFARVVRVELLKLTSTRLGYGLLAVVAGLTPVWTSIAASRRQRQRWPRAAVHRRGADHDHRRGRVEHDHRHGARRDDIQRRIPASHRDEHLPGGARPQPCACRQGRGRAIGGAVYGIVGYLTALAVGLSFTAAHGYRLVIGAGTLADWGLLVCGILRVQAAIELDN